MFKVNDYVVYGLTGVCQIIDIKKEKYLSNCEDDYYVLKPVYNNKMIIKTPVNNPKVLMRKVVTKDDVLSLIAAMPEQETIWIDDYRQRNKNFKSALKTGKCEELIKIIKTIYLEKKKESVIGKKLMKTDEDIMETAKKQLYEEFATALDISPDEVVPYIHERISTK